MLLGINATRAYRLIDQPQLIRSDRIVPQEFPPCPNSPYAPGYDWLFLYERQIAAFLEPWLKPYRWELIGERGIICEALSNAFLHAHAKDPGKVILLRVLLGKAGIMVEIEDSGRGFSVSRVYQGFMNNRRYFSSAGNGFRLMAANPNFGIFYSPAGTILYLVHRFAGDLDRLEADR
jgi:hypothetical protein